jgi:mannitol-1-phosphate 5-dehydrogenase
VNRKSILIFGGGKIGRSFIGQLFGRAGYEVIFSDVDKNLIDALNCRRSYPVVIKSDAGDETMEITNVRAVFGSEENVVREVAQASVIATSVGKNVLGKIIPLMAKGLLKRYEQHPAAAIDIIIAENMRSAAAFMREEFVKCLPPAFPFDSFVGLVETSIGKMVPIMAQADMAKDPLAVFAEPYNTLILDRTAFRNPVPDIAGLAPKENIAAWVDRKAFIHNMGHATAAYYGHYRHPAATYIYEVLDDPEVYDFVRTVMMQAADILLAAYPSDFTAQDLETHIDDLLFRFRNRALKDTIFRVGQDRIRKLGPDDRFMGAIRLAQKYGKDCSLIFKAMSYAFHFTATDENGNRSESDIRFDRLLEQGIECLIKEIDSRLREEAVLKAI